MYRKNYDIQMVITDLDGTLFNDQQEAVQKDLNTLHGLAQQNIIRVVATGRNLYSALNRLKPDFPIDYLIFSSGAGIYHWKSKKLIHSDYLPKEKVKHIARILIDYDIDFMIHELIPENHKFVYYRSKKYNPDFERRFQLYKDFAEPLDPLTETYQHACQIIAITNNKGDLYALLDKEIQGVRIIRATSPLDGTSIWIEVFPESVSKAHGVEWLCRYTGIRPSKTLGIGNDYNDLDLLNFTALSFVVANAPEDLKKIYPACRSNEQCGFTDAVKQIITMD
ncbi:MAG: HAD family hydrolase [Bacteroidales bacterium]|nr:HAD family hydrolase [Bacteroidales bacterium]